MREGEEFAMGNVRPYQAQIRKLEARCAQLEDHLLRMASVLESRLRTVAELRDRLAALEAPPEPEDQVEASRCPACRETAPEPASMCLVRHLHPVGKPCQYSREGEARTAAHLDGAP